ncbi:hypothetical protein [Pontibacter vulgaris]|uniref:hypothetical protein n=1 Tax=Pontibacter vulgaris TaxID=2905679 RepID=UPI001FA6D714|nr:hypothetical protein [Pontibacter vulgaris]
MAVTPKYKNLTLYFVTWRISRKNQNESESMVMLQQSINSGKFSRFYTLRMKYRPQTNEAAIRKGWFILCCRWSFGYCTSGVFM